jgi:hypothetical protein
MKNPYRVNFYSGKFVELSEQEFKKLEPIVMNLEARMVKIQGSTYAINDIRFLGKSQDAPFVQDKNFVPAGQKQVETPREDLGFGNFLLIGNTEKLFVDSANRDEVMLKMKNIWQEHLQRRPAIDTASEGERKKIWDARQKTLPPSERRDKPIFGFSSGAWARFKDKVLDQELPKESREIIEVL